MTGDLTFLGVTKPVTLDVTFNAALGNNPFENKLAFGFSATEASNEAILARIHIFQTLIIMVDLVIETEFIYED